jgi:hypothetical protein
MRCFIPVSATVELFAEVSGYRWCNSVAGAEGEDGRTARECALC